LLTARPALFRRRGRCQVVRHRSFTVQTRHATTSSPPTAAGWQHAAGTCPIGGIWPRARSYGHERRPRRVERRTWLLVEEACAARPTFILEHLHVGEARGVIDRDVKELPAEATRRRLAAAIASYAMAGAREPTELLRVDVDQLAGTAAARAVERARSRARRGSITTRGGAALQARQLARVASSTSARTRWAVR
jgi:hypothetical protein